jgi:hypothetical protein
MSQVARKIKPERDRAEESIISQFQLERLYKTDRIIERLKQKIELAIELATASLVEELRLETEKRQEIESDILRKKKNNLPVQEGRRILKIKVTKGQRRPKYKEILTSLTSEDYVKEIIENTDPSPDKESVEVL